MPRQTVPGTDGKYVEDVLRAGLNVVTTVNATDPTPTSPGAGRPRPSSPAIRARIGRGGQ